VRDSILRTIERKGSLEAGRFKDLRRIRDNGGGGAFSLIVTAHDISTNKAVALKFFDPQKKTEAYRWKSFVRESELLPRFAGQLDILQVVAPLSEFQEPFTSPLGIVMHIPFAYYAVELASTDVNEVILNDGWAVEDKLVNFRVMCRALQRVHHAHVAHRDLKPSNFLVMTDGTLRLSDFGTARCLADAGGAIETAYSGPPGDLGYTAPEIFACLHDVDPSVAFRADIYSLGAILFELFATTPLGLQVIDRSVAADLNRAMNNVQRVDRIRVYDGFVGSLANAHPLPSLDVFTDTVPRSILPLLNRLYMGMAALDYRQRNVDFETIFNDINRCLFVLEHEQAYRRMNERRRLYRGWRDEGISAAGGQC
jgi:serine/threonine protein kinase